MVRSIHFALVLFAMPFAIAAQSAPEHFADRMLDAIGGRERWAALRNTVNDAQQNRLDEPTVVRTVITMDFV